MAKNKNHPLSKTRHHINPSSRARGKPIVGICKVERFLHELFHHLFGNMHPEEIVEYLNKKFWNENYEITIKKKTP
jgi:hypothetical protein